MEMLEEIQKAAGRWEEWLQEAHGKVGFKGERKMLLRCRSCLELVWEGSAEISEHIGHTMDMAVGGDPEDLVAMKWKLFKSAYNELKDWERVEIPSLLDLRNRANLLIQELKERTAICD